MGLDRDQSLDRPLIVGYACEIGSQTRAIADVMKKGGFMRGFLNKAGSSMIIIVVTGVIVFSLTASGFGKTPPDSITFVSRGDSVVGMFYKGAAENPNRTVLLLHGFPGGSNDVIGLGGRLSDSGINVMTFNFRGTGRSSGTYSLAHSQEDIAAAWRYLHSTAVMNKYSIDTSTLILGGYSFGGGMALTYAANHADVPRVFSIAGTDHGVFARQYASDSGFAATIDAYFKELEAPQGPVRFVGREALQELQDNAQTYDLRAAVPQLSDRDMLLIGGLNDQNVTMEEHLLPLYRALQAHGASSIRFHVLQDNHSFSHVREELSRLIENWIKKSY
jgi:pimeloyl-ACP methyl ester carboxylesterase